MKIGLLAHSATSCQCIKIDILKDKIRDVMAIPIVVDFYFRVVAAFC